MYISKHVTFLFIVTAIFVAISGAGIAEAQLDRPGFSFPWCVDEGISVYWQTKNGGSAAAPAGWRLERRNRVSGEWVVDSTDFIGSAADELQTHSNRYWDWTDTTASQNVVYSYRVHALDASSNELADRNWSRWARIVCN